MLSKGKVAEDAENMAFGDEYAPVLMSDPKAKDLILKAIDCEKSNCHTLREIKAEVGWTEERPNGLTDEVILFELQVLKGIEVYHRPGPPVTTYWKLDQKPQDDWKVYIGIGGKVEFIKPGEKKDFSAEIEKRNRQILEAAAKQRQLLSNNRANLHQPSSKNIPSAQKNIAQKPGELEKIQLSNSEVDQLINKVDRIEIVEINNDLLRYNQHNPREFVDEYEDEFIELTDSIREKGVQEPLLVVLNPDGTYRIVAGHRRWRAAIAAGLTTVPCIIKKYPSLEYEIEVMLIENEQRKGLTYTQLAKTYQKLLKTNDVHALARRTGKKQTFIQDLLKLLKLAPEIQLMVDRGELQMGTAKALSVLDFPNQKKLIPRVSRLRVNEAQDLIKKVKDSLGIQKYKPILKTRQRVTTDKEKFTRSGAIKSLDSLGGTFFSPYILQKSFDDVCLDSCMEQKDESICHSCPVPRFIEAAIRRVNKD